MSIKNVKNTIILRLFNTIAPHSCYSCGKIGEILCEYCKYDIESEAVFSCLICRQPTSSMSLCQKCKPSYQKAWSVGVKSGVLEQMIYDYKFERVRDCGKILAGLMASSIGILPSSVVVVPIPTVPKHIRQRGYDHAAILAREISNQNNCQYSQILVRMTSHSQRGSNRKQRLEQARTAFSTSSICSPDNIYLLVDDVITTGATLEYAARALKDAGAKQIWVAVAVYQD